MGNSAGSNLYQNVELTIFLNKKIPFRQRHENQRKIYQMTLMAQFVTLTDANFNY